MKLLGIRFCHVTEQSSEFIDFLSKLGLKHQDCEPEDGSDAYEGGIFTAGDSWVEIWKASEYMPSGTMLQLFVDDADMFAENGRRNGLEIDEPMEAHGERIYFLKAPGGMPVTVQSRV